MKPQKDILITDVIVEESKSRNIELIYVPDQTQTLHKGHEYRFVIASNGAMRLEKS